jgi:hypothetical protein
MIRISARSVDITPQRALDLGGSWSRRGPVTATGVDELLEANLLVIEAADVRVILISIDALYAGPDLATDLSRVCSQKGFPARVFIVATHTHRAPMLDHGKPRLGRFDCAWYGDVLARLVCATEDAMQSLHYGASVSTACQDIDGSVSRRAAIRRPVLYGRRVRCSGTLMGPDVSAPRAPACHCAVFRSGNGEIVCVLVSWACHPAGCPVKDRVSPDYVGSVRRAVRSALGEHPVLFLQGFSGDVRGAIHTRPTVRNLLRRLIRGPVFMTPTIGEWENWTGRIATQIAEIAKKAAHTSGSSVQAVRLGESSVPLSMLLGEGPLGSCSARLLEFGHSLSLFMMTAEVSAEYAPLVEGLGLWPVSCLDNVFGYFPSDAQVPFGGYEVDEFRPVFGLRGRFEGNNDAVFATLLRAAQAELNRADREIREPGDTWPTGLSDKAPAAGSAGRSADGGGSFEDSEILSR